MIILRIFLFPFAVIYDLVTEIRNRLYDQRIKPSVKFEIPVVSIGNLTVGGTGKTPLTEYLIRLLSDDYKLATLSRGYGRKSRGFRMVNASDTASSVGDEPFQLFLKFGDHISVAVGEDRAFAIPNILQQRAETEVILLDDAYQHRSVEPALNILLSDYHRPFYSDHLLPAGRLRESRAGAGRADVVVVTKCPDTLSDEEMIEIEKSIRKYAEKPVFFSHIRYADPVKFWGQQTRVGDTVVLLTGISNASPLKKHITQNYKLVKHFHFADHHSYSLADLRRVFRFMKQNPSASVLTTEKDMVKLNTPEFEELRQTLPLFVVPIELDFVKSGRDFDALVLNSVKGDG